MTQTPPPAGWYPSDGQMRYWDGTQWTQHTAPAQGATPSAQQASPGQPGVNPPGTPGPTGPIGTPPERRPFWKKPWVLITAGVIVLLIIIGAAASGGSGSDDTTATDPKPSASPSPQATKSKPDPKPSKSSEPSASPSTADDTPAADDGTKPSFTMPKQNGDWRLDQFQAKNDGFGDFGGVGRITYTGDDQDGGNNIFTVTLFSADGNTIIATLDGGANSVKPGQTVTVDFISTDKYKSGKFPFTFQNNL